LVELSQSQDVEAGDGTTTVVVIAGALLDAAANLLAKGIHPTAISGSFQQAANKSVEILTEMSTPVELTDRESLIKSASTSLNSKVNYHNSKRTILEMLNDFLFVILFFFPGCFATFVHSCSACCSGSNASY
jgi:chaperonin GroEL (HSP60 family)